MAARKKLQEAAQAEELHPSRRLLHKFFILVSIITGVAAFNMAIGQVIGIAFEAVGPIQYVLRFYVVLLCLLVIMNELNWTSFTRESRILRFWVTRGMFYSFIGLLGLEENDMSSINSESSQLSAAAGFVKAVAWIMIGCGGLYFVMGVCCLQLVYNRLCSKFEERKMRAQILRESATQQIASTV
jgi:hypothetical protein